MKRRPLSVPPSALFLIVSTEDRIADEIRRQLPDNIADALWTRWDEAAFAVYPRRWALEAARRMKEEGFRCDGIRIDGTNLWLARPRRRPSPRSMVAAGVLLAAAAALGVFWVGDHGSAQSRPVAPAARFVPDLSLRDLCRVLANLPAGVQIQDLEVDAARRRLRLKGQAPDYPAVASVAAVFASNAALESPRIDGAHRSSIAGPVEFRSEAVVRSSTTPAGPRTFPPDIEGAISRAADDAGVRRLLSITPSGTALQLEWESGVASSVRFLHEIRRRGHTGALRDLRLSAAAGGVRGRAVVEPGPGRPAATEPAPPDLRTGLFVERHAPTGRAARPDRLLRLREEAERRDSLRREAEQRAQEEARRREEKKRFLESQFTLTGIANDGSGNVAFVNAAGRPPLSVRSGDVVEGARVTAIDDRRGEVRLDHDGQFDVTWRMSPGGAAP